MQSRTGRSLNTTSLTVNSRHSSILYIRIRRVWLSPPIALIYSEGRECRVERVLSRSHIRSVQPNAAKRFKRLIWHLFSLIPRTRSRSLPRIRWVSLRIMQVSRFLRFALPYANRRNLREFAGWTGDELQSIIPFFFKHSTLNVSFLFFLYSLSLECHGFRIRHISFLPILSNYFRSESFPRRDMHRMRHALIHSRPTKSHLQFTFIHGHTISTQSRCDYYYHQCTMMTHPDRQHERFPWRGRHVKP